MNIQIGELAESEKKDWESLYTSYAEFYEMPMTQETLDIVWSWIWDQNNEFYALVARDENANLVGLMHYRAMPSPLRGAYVGFLDDLFVKPQFRGQGVVDQLFNALAKVAKEKGWPFIRWITAENNYRARGLYDKISDKTNWVTYQLNKGGSPL